MNKNNAKRDIYISLCHFCVRDLLCVYYLMYNFIYFYLFLPTFVFYFINSLEISYMSIIFMLSGPSSRGHSPFTTHPNLRPLQVCCCMFSWFLDIFVFVFLSSTICANHTLLNVWPSLVGCEWQSIRVTPFSLDSPFPRSLELPIVARLGMEPWAISRARNLWLDRPEVLWKDHDYYSAKWT